VRERQAVERPADGAVPQRGHAVRKASVHERLRADDAARAPRAVDDDERLGRGAAALACHTSSAPGALMPPGMLIVVNSSCRRASSTTTSAPDRAAPSGRWPLSTGCAASPRPAHRTPCWRS
jgi:hypothetical protein